MSCRHTACTIPAVGAALPRAHGPAPHLYDVSAQAMSRAGRHLREHALTRLVQVHTHGGADCRHSARDDELAYTQREGAVSIVLPVHAAARPSPHEGLVHVRAADGWTALDPASAALVVRLVRSLLDHVD